MNHLVVPRVVAKLMIPYILLYALYVQFHGDYSPGGGFQAGVIFASAVILYTLIFRIAEAERAVPPRVARHLAVVGLLLYAGVGVVTRTPPASRAPLAATSHHDETASTCRSSPVS